MSRFSMQVESLIRPKQLVALARGETWYTNESIRMILIGFCISVEVVNAIIGRLVTKSW